MIDNVCALVVTYNRPQLLCDCLTAIVNQSTSVSEIIILDNYSDEMTLSTLFHAQFIPQYSPEIIITGGVLQFEYLTSISNRIKIHYYRLPQNTGGAGGFNAGMRYFYEQTKCNFLWLMDDDCIPKLSALTYLLNDYINIQLSDSNIGFMCSQVKWRDSTMSCKMASPFISHLGLQYFNEHIQVLGVKSASFVSLLVSRYLISEVGLPIKEFFIWCDDAEFSRRIIKAGFHGYLSLNSIVHHYSVTNISSDELQITDSNFFKYKFGIRNMIAMHRLENDNGMAIKRSLLLAEKIIKSRISFMKKIRLLYSVWLGLTHSFVIEKV